MRILVLFMQSVTLAIERHCPYLGQIFCLPHTHAQRLVSLDTRDPSCQVDSINHHSLAGPAWPAWPAWPRKSCFLRPEACPCHSLQKHCGVLVLIFAGRSSRPSTISFPPCSVFSYWVPAVKYSKPLPKFKPSRNIRLQFRVPFTLRGGVSLRGCLHLSSVLQSGSLCHRCNLASAGTAPAKHRGSGD